MGVQNDPNVQRAMAAVDDDLSQLGDDTATLKVANASLVNAQTAARNADSAVAADNDKLIVDVQALYGAIQNATGIAPAPLAGASPDGVLNRPVERFVRMFGKFPSGKAPTGRASATTIMTWIERVVALLGPLAVPLIEAYLAKASWLTPAELVGINSLLENLIGKIPTGA